MKRFILFFVVAVMLFMVPVLAVAVSPGGGNEWPPGGDHENILPVDVVSIVEAVIIFEESGYDIQVASADTYGSCHSINIQTSSHQPGHPSPAFVSIGKGLFQRRILLEVPLANIPGPRGSGSYSGGDIGG